MTYKRPMTLRSNWMGLQLRQKAITKFSPKPYPSGPALQELLLSRELYTLSGHVLIPNSYPSI